MNYWLLVYPKRLQDLARDLVVAMESVCGPMGMRVSRPSLVELKDDRVETYAKTIRGVLGSEVRRGGLGGAARGVTAAAGGGLLASPRVPCIALPRRTRCSSSCASSPATGRTCTGPSRSCAASRPRCPPR